MILFSASDDQDAWLAYLAIETCYQNANRQLAMQDIPFMQFSKYQLEDDMNDTPVDASENKEGAADEADQSV